MTAPHRATLTGSIPALEETDEQPDSGEVGLLPTERQDF